MYPSWYVCIPVHTNHITYDDVLCIHCVHKCIYYICIYWDTCLQKVSRWMQPILCLKSIYWDTNVSVGLMSNTGIPMDAAYDHSRGDQISNIWISRSIGLPDRSFERRGLRLLSWKIAQNLGTPVKTCLICMGTSRILWQWKLFLIRSPPSVAYVVSKKYLLGYECICWSNV